MPASKQEWTIEDLEMDTTFKIRLSAKNQFGTGDSIESANATTGTNYTAPTAPESVEIIQTQADGCTIQWTGPTDEGGCPIDGFDVFRRPVGTEQWVKANEEFVPITKFKFSQLPVNATYEFKVEAVNEAGFRSPSSPTSAPFSSTAEIRKSL